MKKNPCLENVNKSAGVAFPIAIDDLNRCGEVLVLPYRRLSGQGFMFRFRMDNELQG